MSVTTARRWRGGVAAGVTASLAAGVAACGSLSPPAVSPPPAGQGCPTLEDYSAASLLPSTEPAAPSFEPVPPHAAPSTGILALGQTGIVPAPDGSPGALVRVSNARICDRLPDIRPDDMGGPAELLLADVEIEALKAGALPTGFIPGQAVVVANYGGRGDLRSPLVFGMPGGNMTTAMDTGPGFSYRGTMAWVVPSTDVRVTIDVLNAETDPEGKPPNQYGRPLTQFAYVARAGTDFPSSFPPPEPTTDPDASPTTGVARLGEPVILAGDGGTMPLVVDGIEQVPRYTGVTPTPPFGGFLEVHLSFANGSGSFRFVPAEWVVVGPGGDVLPELERPRSGSVPPGFPNVASSSEPLAITADWPLPLFIVAHVPAAGRVSLEYRPAGGPALVTWILREV